VQQLNSPSADQAAQKSHPGNVAARTIETRNQSIFDRVAAIDENDRPRGRRYSAISSAAVRGGPSVTVSMISCQADRLRPTMAGGTTNSMTDIFMAHLRIAQSKRGLLRPRLRAPCPMLQHGSPRYVLLLPLLGGHGLVRDTINDIVLRALVEHSEVLTQDHKGCQLVVHLDANRAVGALRHCRDRGGRVLVELVARDQQNSVDDNLDALAVLCLLADLDARPRYRSSDREWIGVTSPEHLF